MLMADFSSIFIFLSFYVSCFALNKLRVLPHINNETSRIGYIDGLRGVAATLVVCAHSWRLSYSESFERKWFYDSLNFDHRLGAIGVQLFFCITGYLFISKLLKNKNQKWDRFFIARIRRLAPAYFFAVTILIFITFFKSSSFGINEVVSSVKLYAFGLLGTDLSVPGFNGTELFSVLWSLPYEWKFYFMMPAIAACMYARWTTILAIIAAALSIVVVIYLDGSSFGALFASGALAAYLDKKIHLHSSWLRHFLFFGSLAILVYTTSIDLNNYGIERLSVASLFFISVIISRPKILCDSALRFMGEISYSVYLLHIICYFAFASLFDIYLSTASIPAYAFAFSIFTCIICSLSFKYIEHPFIKVSAPKTADSVKV